LGVFLTISDQEKARKKGEKSATELQKERFRLENLPVFYYTHDSENKSNSRSCFFIDCDSSEAQTTDWYFNLYIRNIGLRAATHIFFEITIDGKCDKQIQELSDYYIKPDEQSEISVLFKAKNILLGDLTKENFQKIYDESFHTFIITVNYDDLIGTNYKQEILGSLALSPCVSANNQITSTKNMVCIQNTKPYEIIDAKNKTIEPPETFRLAKKLKEYEKRFAEFEKIESKEIIDKLVGAYIAKNSFKIMLKIHIKRLILILVTENPLTIKKSRLIYIMLPHGVIAE